MPASIDNPSMLVIERQSALAAVISRVAQKAGIYAVATTTSSAEASELLTADRFNIIVVEVHEWALAEKRFVDILRQHREMGAVLGLMASALERNITIVAREEIWDFFLIKPFSPDTLKMKLSARGFYLSAAPSGPKPSIKAAVPQAIDTTQIVEI